MSRWGRVGALACLVMFGACDCQDTTQQGGDDVGVGAPDASDGSDTPDARATPDTSRPEDASDDGSTDGGASDGGPTSYEAFCRGGVDEVAGVCGGDLAQTTFRFAMCSCSDFVTSGALAVDAFDSSMGPYMAGSARGGSVGINGTFNTSAAAAVGGSLWVGEDLVSGQDVRVGLDLNGRGDVSSGELEVARDARIGGDARVSGGSIGGDLVTADGSDVESGTPLSVGGQESTAMVSFDDPCDCRDDLLVDVDGFIAAARDLNDNDVVGVDSGAFDNVNDARSQALACGRYYFSRITGGGSLRLELEGRTAIYVEGDVSIAGLDVALAPGATLDMFVSGQVTVSGGFSLGDEDRPAATRIYVAGEESVNVSGGVSIAANIYAPRSQVVIAGDAEFYGSVFAQRVNTSGAVTIHHDTAILSAGDECDEPEVPGEDAGMTPADAGDAGQPPGGEACTNCRDCGNQACQGDGTCGACGSGADCCSPLVCVQGECVYYPL